MLHALLDTLAWWWPEINLMAFLGFFTYILVAACACVHLISEAP